jgi:hypothetical protein
MTRQVRAVVASLALAALSVSTASARDQSQVVVIVRHAEKADAPNGDVALSDRSRASRRARRHDRHDRAPALEGNGSAAGLEPRSHASRRPDIRRR